MRKRTLGELTREHSGVFSHQIAKFLCCSWLSDESRTILWPGLSKSCQCEQKCQSNTTQWQSDKTNEDETRSLPCETIVSTASRLNRRKNNLNTHTVQQIPQVSLNLQVMPGRWYSDTVCRDPVKKHRWRTFYMGRNSKRGRDFN